ncbi:MAG: cupredoxin domain-containing protein [Parcubacteria group bacterium]|nr:cupredoxin domain-containing protein [Parcubacteria group bacterium]MCR4342357.1 cupredoxin domain-containing protein [Patescibacteria group bacterium]
MNNKKSFINKYFVIAVILIAVGSVYYFKFYRTDDSVIDNGDGEADKSGLIEENNNALIDENNVPAQKVIPKASSEPTSQAEPNQTILLKNNFISIKNNAFSPSVIVIKRGTEITWTNEDNFAHQIASDSSIVKNPLPELESKILAKGQSYIFMFTRPGTFDYYCRIHPFMKGTIIVTD